MSSRQVRSSWRTWRSAVSSAGASVRKLWNSGIASVTCTEAMSSGLPAVPSSRPLIAEAGYLAECSSILSNATRSTVHGMSVALSFL